MSEPMICEECGRWVCNACAHEHECFGEWIPVATQLPVPDAKVLVSSASLQTFIGTHKGNRWYDVKEYGEVPDVTHWMPLPKTPAP
jgi:hypothetical protein